MFLEALLTCWIGVGLTYAAHRVSNGQSIERAIPVVFVWPAVVLGKLVDWVRLYTVKGRR